VELGKASDGGFANRGDEVFFPRAASASRKIINKKKQKNLGRVFPPLFLSPEKISGSKPSLGFRLSNRTTRSVSSLTTCRRANFLHRIEPAWARSNHRGWRPVQTLPIVGTTPTSAHYDKNSSGWSGSGAHSLAKQSNWSFCHAF